MNLLNRVQPSPEGRPDSRPGQRSAGIRFAKGLHSLSQCERPTGISISKNTVAENRPVGTFVGSLSATDPDQNSTFKYTLVAIAGSTDHTKFKIVGNKLQTASILDFETKNSYTIKVRVTDQLGLSFTKTFTIFVTNVIE